MRDKFKGFITGVCVTLILSGIVTAFAATIDVEMGGIRVFWDGEEKTLTDVNGQKVEPMIYNGTTYVPVRAMAELMGKDVEWDDASRSVYVGGNPSGLIATAGDTKITDLDVNYYIYAQAASYAQNNGIAFEDLAAFDWNQEVDGKKLSDTIIENAVNDAINEAVALQKGKELGFGLTDSELSQINTQIDGILAAYGEDGFTLRTRAMGVATPEQYAKMYRNVMALQKFRSEITANTAAYLPEDVSILNDYIQPGKGSVKHILFANEEGGGDKYALAESVLKKIQVNGEDFDALVTEYNEDPGAGTTGYTFVSGEMVPEFEQAAFGLKINEISGIVKTDYGYHIIKRIPGFYELQGYWRAENSDNIKINTESLNNLDVASVMLDMINATNELSAQGEQSEQSE